MTVDASSHPAAGWLLWSAVLCNVAWTAAAVIVALAAVSVRGYWRRADEQDRADRGEDEPWRESLRDDDDLAGAGRP